MGNLTFKIEKCVYRKLVRNSDTRQKFKNTISSSLVKYSEWGIQGLRLEANLSLQNFYIQQVPEIDFKVQVKILDTLNFFKAGSRP